MISGMYMGELVRSVAAYCTRQGLMFGGNGSKELFTPHMFKSAYVSAIESDPKGVYTNIKASLDEINLQHATVDDYENLKLICNRISTRAAHLASASLATVLNRIKRPHTTIGIDGSVYKYHPNFNVLMEKKVAELTNPEYKFTLMLSEDGSGRGAALVAAVAVRQQEELKRNQKTKKTSVINGNGDTVFAPAGDVAVANN